jgi:predicted nucleotidyltransferase component of viral defense system
LITTAQMHQFAEKEGLRFDQAEKDYVIVWVLFALSKREEVLENWALKGGTCLRHCYYPGYRFSEDIDFSCKLSSSNLSKAQALLGEAAQEVEKESGIRLRVKEPQDTENDAQVEIALEYSRGGARRQRLPAVKVHLTFDEPVLIPPEHLWVHPLYPDVPTFTVSSYAKIEIVAEKMRALLQQQKKWPRPRDLYDLWCILCRNREQFPKPDLADLFKHKCDVRSVSPDPARLISEDLFEWNRQAWGNQLAPMLKDPPNYGEVWKAWVAICKDLF